MEKYFYSINIFFKKFNRSLLSLYPNTVEGAREEFDYCKGSIKIPENKFYISSNLCNGTINFDNFNEDDEINNSL